MTCFSDIVAFLSFLAKTVNFLRRCRRRLISFPRSLIPPTGFLSELVKSGRRGLSVRYARRSANLGF